MRATETLRTALKAIVEEEGLPWPTKTVIEPPREARHGDLSTNLALLLAKEAKAHESTVTIVDKNGKSVDATRLMALMGMGIKCGDTVTVKIEGADEDTAAPALEKFFNEHL